jgi:hypothetical protein
MTKKVILPADLQWLMPVQISDLIRIGRSQDGGYIVPESIVRQADGLLSLGLGDDWSFDQHWHDFHPTQPIHMYDGNPTGDWNNALKTQYQKFWVGDCVHYQENIGPENLALAVKRLNCKNIFIKMDIEGAEYPLLDTILSLRDNFIGIVLEMHDCNGLREKFKQAVLKIQQYYTIVHFHGNNYAGDTLNNQPALLTDAMELTLVRKDLCVNNKPRPRVFLTDLDFPNCVNFEDIEYSFDLEVIVGERERKIKQS